MICEPCKDLYGGCKENIVCGKNTVIKGIMPDWR